MRPSGIDERRRRTRSGPLDLPQRGPQPLPGLAGLTVRPQPLRHQRTRVGAGVQRQVADEQTWHAGGNRNRATVLPHAEPSQHADAKHQLSVGGRRDRSGAAGYFLDGL
jgi:hypothetical protein